MGRSWTRKERKKKGRLLGSRNKGKVGKALESTGQYSLLPPGKKRHEMTKFPGGTGSRSGKLPRGGKGLVP